MAKFTWGDAVAGILFLIALYLVFSNWNGANQLLTTATGSVNTLVKTLQARS